MTTQLGTIVARAILSGDVSRAHAEAGGRTTWTVTEARAISGACRIARERFAGCAVSLADFMGSRPVAPGRRTGSRSRARHVQRRGGPSARAERAHGRLSRRALQGLPMSLLTVAGNRRPPL